MDVMGFEGNKEKVEAVRKELIGHLDSMAAKNEGDEVVIHSIVMTWDEAHLVEPYLEENSRGKNAAYARYSDSALSPPFPDLSDFGEYKGIRLYVRKAMEARAQPPEDFLG